MNSAIIPTVSVLMCEYNTPKDHLERAIESILSQTFKDFELIIVNDASKNNLEKITDKYQDKRIRIVNNKKNLGFVESLNIGLGVAKGKYIVRMDSDDITMKSRISKLYAYIENHPEYSVVGTRAVIFSGSKNEGFLGKPGEKTKRSIMRGDIIIHASAIMKKQDIISVGGYRSYKRAEDLALWCELLIMGYRLYAINDVLYKYRVDLQDYNKRKLRYRGGELKARINYYPKLGATPFDYLFIIKSILAGITPNIVMRYYHRYLKLDREPK